MNHTQRLSQPEEFGKYQLVARLAHGPMADVYKAKSHGVEGFEKILVVKVIHLGLAAIPGFVDTLIEEAKRAVSLSHANVAQVYDLGREDAQQRVYIATEYIKGFDLGRTMNLARSAGKPLPPELAVFIISEVAKGLDYAHRRKDFNFNSLNIVHRSLCPGNIMLSFDGEVKLTDFGISRAMDGLNNLSDDDLRRRYLYTAPEVLRGEPYTPQADIFAMGLMLYQMLTGTHPYEHEDLNVVAERARNAHIPSITQILDLPRPLVHALESMLVLQPSGRASSAGTIYEELIGYLFANNLKGDNHFLSIFMQELRRWSRTQQNDEPILEVGLEEISLHELQISFDLNDALLADATGSLEISEATRSSLPSAKLSQLFNKDRSAGEELPVLPGAFENYFNAASHGQGKAVLASGRLGRGRQYLPDRLSEALVWRANTLTFSIHTTSDDRYRPFGVLGDLIQRYMTQSVSGAADPRHAALQALQYLNVSPQAIAVLAGIWNLQEQPRIGPQERRQHLTALALAILKSYSATNTLVLIINHVERVDRLTLDVLRDIIAQIGRLPVMLVLCTNADESMRAAFDTGRPEDLEALRISGEEPPTPQELQNISPLAKNLLALLTLAERALSQAELAMILNTPVVQILPALNELVEHGAIRVPETGMFVSGINNISARLQETLGFTQTATIANLLVRYFTHRNTGDSFGTMTNIPSSHANRNHGMHQVPTLIRLNAIAGERRRMLRLAEAYTQYLDEQGWQQTRLDTFQYCATLLAQESLGAPHARMNFILAAAELALATSQLETCRTLLQPLAALAEKSRNERAFVRGQLLLGQMAMQNDDLDDARTYFQRSATTARGLNDSALLAQSLLAMAGWHERYGNLATAQSMLERALTLFSFQGTRHMNLLEHATLLHRTIRIRIERDMPRLAEQPMRDLRELANRTRIPAIECRADSAEARLFNTIGRHDQAILYLERAVQTAEQFNLKALHIDATRELAVTQLESGNPQAALHTAEHLIQLAAQNADHYSEQRARDIKAFASCILSQNVALGLDHLNASLARATERNILKDIYRGHNMLARALRALNQHTSADSHTQKAQRIAQSMHHRIAS